ncbi:MAG: hypothetical protein AAF556_02310 [Pseudomonadota bacterium]
MRIKSFTAPSMAEAMILVKEALGEDAIIVSTREQEGAFRVTAALDDGGDDGYDDLPGPDMTDPGALRDAEELAADEDEADDEYGDGETVDLDNMLLTPDGLPDTDDDGIYGATGDNDTDAPPHRNVTESRPVPDWAKPQGEPEFIHQLADSSYSLLIDHGTPRRLAHAIGDHIDEELGLIRDRQEMEPGILEALTHGIRRQFSFQTPAELWTERPLLMVGPHGSGKTLALAKMTARAVLRGVKPVVITTDVVRAGAIEQLAAFTRIMDIELKTADEPHSLRQLIEDLPEGRHQVLIDTAAVNPFDQEAVDLLGEMVSEAKAEPLIVLAAGTDPVEAGTIATSLRAIGARHLIATRLDAATRFGSLLAAADLGRLHLAYLGRSTSVTAGLQEAQPETLAELLAAKGGLSR